MRAVLFLALAHIALIRPACSAEARQAGAQEAAPTVQAAPEAAQPPQAASHGVGHTLLLYLPNRLFDVLDVVRVRVRLGPGLALGARVTKLTDIFLGSYATVYLGLPGPRQVPRVPWPFGIESRSGLAASVADATVTSYDSNPRYAVTEMGAGAQAILAGAEVGVDPVEIFDLVFGFLTIDLRDDDL